MNLRSFIAVEIPADVQRAISQGTGFMRNSFQKPLVRWVESQNIHLTLKFLGDVSPEKLERIAVALKDEIKSRERFSMTVNGLGVFPNSSHPRIIWIGLTAPPALIELQRCVEQFSSRMGYAPEERPFSPHLTIGRIGQAATQAGLAEIKAALDSHSIGNIGTVQVDSLNIYKSDLQAGGPVYTRLYRIPMKNN
jgi:RNA 2',3'-cyclic 3'-phosphodiesterase